MAQEKVQVGGMSCQHCVARVRSALESLEGVEIQNLEIGSVSLDVDHARTTRDEVLAAIRSAGYSAE